MMDHHKAAAKGGIIGINKLRAGRRSEKGFGCADQRTNNGRFGSDPVSEVGEYNAASACQQTRAGGGGEGLREEEGGRKGGGRSLDPK